MATHTIRADDGTILKLKALAESLNLTQGQTLDQLINVYEGQKLVEAAPSRQAELDRFNTAIKTINEIYQHSVTLWLDADEQATTKISKQMHYLKEANNELLRKNTELTADLTVAKATIAKQEQQIQKLQEQIAQTESLNDILQSVRSAFKVLPTKSNKQSPPPEATKNPGDHGDPDTLDIEEILALEAEKLLEAEE